MKKRNCPNFHDGGGYSGLRARNLTFKKIVKRVMRDQSRNHELIQMENMIRRVVREETTSIIERFLASWVSMERSRSETPSSRPRFKLRFINSPPSSIFTGSKIVAENGTTPLMIELVDVSTNARVVSGPLSSSRVELVPLDGDFAVESWTVEGFKQNILKQREGKRPLLTGVLMVTLQKGLGVITGDVSFSDNSSWTRSGQFRLGAKLTGDGAVEARSQSFVCRDQRGESYRKHHPPYPLDDVWRLERIAKDGVSAKRLAEYKIYTVKDFRRLYTMDPNALYKIVGISKKAWKVIVSHAMDCVLDAADECFIYNTNSGDVTLLFNSFYELIKVSFGGGGFQNVDQLANYKPILDDLKFEAYQNLDRFISANPFVSHPQRSLQCPQDPGFGFNFQGSLDPSSSSMPLYHTASSSTLQHEMLMRFNNSSTATVHIDPKFLPNLGNNYMVNELDHVLNKSQTVMTRGCLENEEEDSNDVAYHQHFDMPSNWSPGTHQAFETMCLTVSGTNEPGTFDVRVGNVNLGSPRARWCKVKAALRLRGVWRHTTTRNRGNSCTKPCLPY